MPPLNFQINEIYSGEMSSGEMYSGETYTREIDIIKDTYKHSFTLILLIIFLV